MHYQQASLTLSWQFQVWLTFFFWGGANMTRYFGVTKICIDIRTFFILYKTQLMLTNPCNTFRGKSMSPNMVPFDVRYGFLLVFYSNFVPKKHCFWDDFKKCCDLEIRVRSHSRTSELTRIDPPPMTSSHLCILVPAVGVPLGIGYLGVKKLEWWGYWAEKEVWWYLQPSGYNTQMWRIEGRTGTGWQQRPHFCIATSWDLSDF